ncbi:MAG: aminodeoxychorismate synthase component I [Candidatus Omnitrophota bacterium]
MAYYILKSYKLKFSSWEIFDVFSREKNCFFLDSSLSNYPLGRYSFLGIEPFFILKTKNQDPFKLLREQLESYSIALSNCKLPFFGGAVGYLAYDLGFELEKKLKPINKPGLDIPDCFLGFYNTAVIIDHYKNLFYILALGFPEKRYYPAKKLAERNFKRIYDLICDYRLLRPLGARNDTGKGQFRNDICLESNFTREQYIQAVKKAKEYIKQGDIYQVNLAQMFSAKTGLSAGRIYNRLRQVSPACFSAYFDTGDFQLISSSPERFLKLEDNLVTTCPMKGTRPRSKNRLKDRGFRSALLRSSKDAAELMMIVDLERNDLGRVCSYDSIAVPKLRQLEEYSTVFQTTASISGRLHKNKDRCDLLRACFPGGSITGCPKIRAMEIIEELEPARRSIYTGSLGYLSFSGDMDFNILIRTILKKDNLVYFGAGGGIVADSVPEDEYEETLVKAKGILEAMGSFGIFPPLKKGGLMHCNIDS